MHIAQNIRFLRKSKGWNQAKLGELAGVSNATISSYESEINLPGLETLISLAKIFEVSVDDLLFRDLEKVNAIDVPTWKLDQLDDIYILRINKLMEQRIKVLETLIRKHNPELADEWGIE